MKPEDVGITLETARKILRMLGDDNVTIEVGMSAMVYALCMVSITEGINKRSLISTLVNSIDLMYAGNAKPENEVLQ